MTASAALVTSNVTRNVQQVADDPALADQSLEVLLRRACADEEDPAAWNELHRRFGRLLLHTARRVGLNDSDAAEAVQQAWVRLWERGHQIRDPESLPAWLAATTRRESLRLAISGKRYLLCADPTAEHGERCAAAATDVYPVDGDYEPALEQALTRLPPLQQRVIRLLMSDTCPSYGEVAQLLGLPIGSIGPIRMRALRALRDTPELAACAPSSQR